MSRKFLILFSVLLVTIASGCSFGMVSEKITEEKAEIIAIEDAPKFKSDNSKFKVYKTEQIDKGWRVMVSSLEPPHEEVAPNIWYEISVNGNIIVRENMALEE
ncbi:hypothetical protein LF817_09300 [Halobacillus sp. A1]|uniref:hypothetical protein n=1 Tax=Halobacillus sp. A1 TaxID=2880262 RepID=UPI0020A638D1|nr:hypothetical protein [Halobacillus sp. A1]MCP3031544.1 hypothetical protein [Halobacillus sp. A1]